MGNVKRNVFAIASLVERLLRDNEDYPIDKKIDDLAFCVEDNVLDAEEAIRLALKYIRNN